MTIYYCTLRSDTLSKFASSAKIIQLCVHICRYFYIHLHNKALAADITSQLEIKRQFDILRNTFKKLRCHTNDDSILRIIHQVKVTFMYAKFAHRNEIKYVQCFSLKKLDNIPVRIMLALAMKMINDSLICLKPYLTNMPELERQACYQTLTAVPIDISNVVTKFLDIYEGDVSKVATSPAFVIQLKAEFCDNREDRVDLTK